MSSPEKLDLCLTQGKTFTRVIRWEKEPFVYKPITAITRAAPARITATSHGLVDGWRVAVVSVLGMRQINAESAEDGKPPAERDFVRATVVDPNTVELNTVNAAEFSPYTSGGYLQFYTPASLAGCTARMVIKDRIGGTVLASLSDTAGIALNDTTKTITVTLDADDLAAFTWTRGVYELEVEDGSGVVTGLYYGTVTVSKEIAT